MCNHEKTALRRIFDNNKLIKYLEITPMICNEELPNCVISSEV